MQQIAWVAILPYIGTVLTFVISIYTLLSLRGKRRADAASVLTATAIDLVNELSEELSKLKDRVTELEKLLKTKEERIEILEKQRSTMAKKLAEMAEHTLWRDNELMKTLDRVQQLEHERAELEGEIVLLNGREDRRRNDYEILVVKFDQLINQLTQQWNASMVVNNDQQIIDRDRIIRELQTLLIT